MSRRRQDNEDGYVFNKIGTYQVISCSKGAILLSRRPASSFDLKRTPMTRSRSTSDEVVKIRGRRTAPKGVPVANPAFDRTPPELVTAIITDRGIISSPVQDSIAAVIR